MIIFIVTMTKTGVNTVGISNVLLIISHHINLYQIYDISQDLQFDMTVIIQIF